MKTLTTNKGYLALDAIIGITILSIAIFALARTTIFFSNVQAINSQEFKNTNIISNYLESLYEKEEWETQTVVYEGIEFNKKYNETDYHTEQLKITVKEEKEFILERVVP